MTFGRDYVDLNFLGIPQIIATAVLRYDGGAALVDPGPSSTRRQLEAALADAGVEMQEVRQLLLTHIHLDHAGASGTLVRAHPHIEVFVHERGAPHMIDPSKLLSSASRLYGADMDRLWGEFLPVPADRVRVLRGGERITVAGRELEVAYTPGHASHHVSYFDRNTGVAFVGDAAGIRRGVHPYVMPPTPPPDIDLPAWRASVERILAWKPQTLFLTHFGPFGGPDAHFRELLGRLDDWTRLAERLLDDPSLDDVTREQHFVDEVLEDLTERMGAEQARQYHRAGRIDYSWQGLARYLRKRSAG
jgi:glyoxylase-like metal-dependent hydrolase (beta-lactamase superfamily II)